jgi:hypothetical protein
MVALKDKKAFRTLDDEEELIMKLNLGEEPEEPSLDLQ